MTNYFLLKLKCLWYKCLQNAMSLWILSLQHWCFFVVIFSNPSKKISFIRFCFGLWQSAQHTQLFILLFWVGRQISILGNLGYMVNRHLGYHASPLYQSTDSYQHRLKGWSDRDECRGHMQLSLTVSSCDAEGTKCHLTGLFIEMFYVWCFAMKTTISVCLIVTL